MKPVPTLDNRGVTFIEMIIVMAIFAFVAGVTLFSYRKFNSNVRIQNITQDVAISVTRAQRTAIAGAYPRFLGASGEVEEAIQNSFLADIAPEWAPSYGVHVAMTLPDRLTYFYDVNDDTDPNAVQDAGRYIYQNDGGPDDCTLGSFTSECLDVLQFPEQYTFTAICINQDSLDIGNPASCTTVDWVDIVFTRPEPAPIITSSLTGTPIASVTFYILESNSGIQKTVSVYATGQVQVQ